MSTREGPTLRFCGAAGTVTGSKFLLTFSDRRVLIDAGLFQGQKHLRLRNWSDPPFDPAALDAVVLTHAHIDHAGCLPILARRGFHGPVHCTSGTRDLLEILLPDAASLQEEEASYANRKGYSKHHPALPLFDLADVRRALSLVRTHGYGEAFPAAAGLTASFRRAGHILGSASIELGIDDPPLRLLVSGDLGRWDQPILVDPEPARGPVDVLLVESTYGDRRHAADPAQALARVVNEAVARGGALLVPAFAVGRTQLLIWMLRELEDQGRIPRLPVFIDSPMANRVSEVYCRHDEDLDEGMKAAMDASRCPLCCRTYSLVATAEESKQLNRRTGPMVVIAGSGMATGGRILHHLKQRLPDARTTVLLVGFQAAGTRGRTLREGATRVKMLGEEVSVRAKVETLDGLSAHADHDDLVRWLATCPRPRKTWVVHGEPQPAETVAAMLRQDFGWDAAVAQDGERVELSPVKPPADDRHVLRVRAIGIDTWREHVVYMRSDCHVCRSEGFQALARVRVTNGSRSLIATLNVVTSGLLAAGEAGLSDAALRRLGVADGDTIALSHAPVVESLGHVRAKIHGRRLGTEAMREIVQDVVGGLYSDAHIASFVTACANDHLDSDETVALTRAMIEAGDRLRWSARVVADKHCVGGLPGNRTTMIVVPIVAACGLVIPKTSSRAITSPSGTADAMETMAPVELDTARMRRVVEREGGCIAWGGGLRLSPADEVLIAVERALDLDSEGQLVASVLSKKVAAGSSHVVIDMPVGPTAKVRSPEAAERLGRVLTVVGEAIGLRVRIVVSDGTQPVGRGIGPALEAKEVRAVLQGDPGASPDLRERSLRLAAEVLVLAGDLAPDAAAETARAVLEDGRAWKKLVAICEAQGGMRDPPVATHLRDVVADRGGVVSSIDNRRLARIAKLAGAPVAKAAGLVLRARVGTRVERGQPLYTLHAEAPGELAYALAYARSQRDVVRIESGERADDRS